MYLEATDIFAETRLLHVAHNLFLSFFSLFRSSRAVGVFFKVTKERR